MCETEQERREFRIEQLGECGAIMMEILDRVWADSEPAGLGGHEFKQGAASAISMAREEVRKSCKTAGV